MPLRQGQFMQSIPPQYPPQFQSQPTGFNFQQYQQNQPQNQSQPTAFNLQKSQQTQLSYSNEINDKPPNYDGFINQASTIRIEGNDAGNTMPVIPAPTVSKQ